MIPVPPWKTRPSIPLSDGTLTSLMASRPDPDAARVQSSSVASSYRNIAHLIASSSLATVAVRFARRTSRLPELADMTRDILTVTFLIRSFSSLNLAFMSACAAGRVMESRRLRSNLVKWPSFLSTTCATPTAALSPPDDTLQTGTAMTFRGRRTPMRRSISPWDRGSALRSLTMSGTRAVKDCPAIPSLDGNRISGISSSA
mmetsp:Transcript_16594/g.34014  ORF Transcript_16594/g.34014 Transcript_16594/m.34014 type:complete len:202 (+) Transcript_16594:640-1245(+)